MSTENTNQSADAGANTSTSELNNAAQSSTVHSTQNEKGEPVKKSESNSTSDDKGTRHSSKADNEPILNYQQVRELRDENKNNRLTIDRLKQELDSTKTLVESERKRADEIRIFSELKAEAIRAGINDIDDVYKLADVTKVKITDRGDVVGASDVITTLQTQKPYLFRDSTASQLSHGMPPAKTKSEATKEKLTIDQQAQKINEIKKKHSHR